MYVVHNIVLHSCN